MPSSAPIAELFFGGLSMKGGPNAAFRGVSLPLLLLLLQLLLLKLPSREEGGPEAPVRAPPSPKKRVAKAPYRCSAASSNCCPPEKFKIEWFGGKD